MNFEVNPNKEYVLCGDISASMQTPNDPRCGGLTRYNYMLEKFKLFMATTADFDKHGGCTVMLFGKEVTKYEHADITTVIRKLVNVTFEPMTNTDLVIREAFEEHMEEVEKQRAEDKLHPGTIVMIFTDGQPTNEPAVMREIMNISNQIKRESDFQIVFLTVGTIDLSLSQFLNSLLEIHTRNRTGFKIVRVLELDKVEFLEALETK